MEVARVPVFASIDGEGHRPPADRPRYVVVDKDHFEIEIARRADQGAPGLAAIRRGIELAVLVTRETRIRINKKDGRGMCDVHYRGDSLPAFATVFCFGHDKVSLAGAVIHTPSNGVPNLRRGKVQGTRFPARVLRQTVDFHLGDTWEYRLPGFPAL